MRRLAGADKVRLSCNNMKQIVCCCVRSVRQMSQQYPCHFHFGKQLRILNTKNVTTSHSLSFSSFHVNRN